MARNNSQDIAKNIRGEDFPIGKPVAPRGRRRFTQTLRPMSPQEAIVLGKSARGETLSSLEMVRLRSVQRKIGRLR